MVVFHWSQSDSKSTQISRTLLSILADFNSDVVWMVSVLLLIFGSPFLTFEGLPRALTKIGIIVTFMFHSFFSPLARSKNLFTFSSPFILTHCSAATAKSWWSVPFFLLIKNCSSHLVWIWWYVFGSKSEKILWVTFSRTDSGFCRYYLFEWLNSNLLHSKFPQVSRIFLSILTDLNNTVVWMVFTHPLILLILWWLYQEHPLQVVSPSPSCSSVFSVL